MTAAMRMIIIRISTVVIKLVYQAYRNCADEFGGEGRKVVALDGIVAQQRPNEVRDNVQQYDEDRCS